MPNTESAAIVPDLTEIVRSEFLEIPGLQLTKPQVRRLWALDESTCDRLLETLVHEHFLRMTARGQYTRA